MTWSAALAPNRDCRSRPAMPTVARMSGTMATTMLKAMAPERKKMLSCAALL
jgi:hypothetical protein